MEPAFNRRAYTTFSMLAQESRDLLAGGHGALAVANVLGSSIAGVGGVVVGIGAGRAL